MGLSKCAEDGVLLIIRNMGLYDKEHYRKGIKRRAFEGASIDTTVFSSERRQCPTGDAEKRIAPSPIL